METTYIIIDVPLPIQKVFVEILTDENVKYLASDNEPVDFDFDECKVEVTRTPNGLKVTNAMNGWGHNCKKDFENAKIKIA